MSKTYKYDPAIHNFFPKSKEELEYRDSKCLSHPPIGTPYGMIDGQREIPMYALDALCDKNTCHDCRHMSALFHDKKVL